MLGLCHLRFGPGFPLLQRATALVERIMDPHEQTHQGEGPMVTAGPLVEPYRCHEVARAVGQVLDLPVQDGWYGAVDHSWLWVHAGADPYGFGGAILDVYCVGRLPMVQLVTRDRQHGHYAAGGLVPSLYREGPVRTDIRLDVVKAMIKDICLHEVFNTQFVAFMADHLNQKPPGETP